jgi:alkanesulfonate monooxygenase SsuD/methylene tetrahydromethanopterin reductase-like flavin-dependent oxidoreductase (luciferase family)
VYSEAMEEAGREPDGDNWRLARTILVAPSDTEAEEYVLDPKRATHAYFDYLIKLLKTTNGTGVIKPHADMADDELDADAVVKSVVIAGSPKTVVEKLLGLRERVGPFGTVLVSGMDWDGPNGPMERQSMELLSEAVMPEVNRALLGRA